MNITKIYIENIDKVPQKIKKLYENYSKEIYYWWLEEVINMKWELFVEECEKDFVKRMWKSLFE